MLLADRHSAASTLRGILGDPASRRAVEHLGTMIRELGFVSVSPDPIPETAFGRWASQQPVTGEFAAEMLGGVEALRACLDSGLVLADLDGNLRLSVSLLSGAGAVGVAPGSHDPGERVYSGPDTWILLEKAWRFGLGGRRAIELGTGTGTVATFLTSRYDQVLATDVTEASIATASISRLLLEEPRRSRLSILRADVGRGLAPGSFDLVVGNTPWVPTAEARGQIFADGGASGFELPSRFLNEGLELLSDHGVMVLLCADWRFADGRAPLVEALRRIRSQGFTTEIEETPNTEEMRAVSNQESGSLNGLASGQHVTVVAYRKEVTGPSWRRDSTP